MSLVHYQCKRIASPDPHTAPPQKSLNAWQSFNAWIAKDDDAAYRPYGWIRYRTSAMYIGIRLGVDVTSQLVLGDGAWDWGRMLSSLVVMPFEVHYMPQIWRVLEKTLPSPNHGSTEKSDWEFQWLTQTKAYNNHWIVGTGARVVFEYFVLSVPGCGLFEVAATLGLQYLFGEYPDFGWHSAEDIALRLGTYCVGGLFWPIFNMYNLHATASPSIRLRNGMILSVAWSLISTATSSGTALPWWAYGIPYVVSAALALKAYSGSR